MKNILVVLNYNDYKTTIDFIEKIKEYKVIDFIIIVDNNSTDSSYKKLSELTNKRIILLKSDKNGGYGYGNNIGIKYAVENYGICNIIISNPDIEVEEKTIKKLIKVLNSKKEYGLIGPIINTKGVLERGWKLSTGFQELLLTIPKYGTYKRNKIIGYKDSYYKDDITEVDVISGCFFIAKSNILKEINYFDENLFLYYEENVIAKKLKRLNYKVVLDNTSEVIHNHSVSIDKNHSSIKKYKILRESQMYYLNNYCNTNILIKILIKCISKLRYLKKEK